MKTRASAAAVLLSLATLAAHAAAFDPVSQERMVSIRGNVAIVNNDTGETQTQDFHDSSATAPGEFGASDLHVGMALRLESGGAAMYGDGQSRLQSTAGPDVIEFDGLVDANASGSVDYPYGGYGYANAHVDFRYSFHVAHDTPVQLWMSSATSIPYSDQYRFLLARADGSTVWGDTLGFDADGNPLQTFTQGLLLNSGDYTLTASLQASSNFDNGSAYAGRAEAQFRLSAVPEPAALGLFAAGLVMLVPLGRLKRVRA